MVRLRRADCVEPGIRRRRRGKGFSYLDEASGERIDDVATLQRIRELAIPPAWEDVWICPDSRGHLQAVGRDAAGRRQYRYHEGWRRRRDGEKFDRMLRFARQLPTLRQDCARLLESTEELTRDRVLACAVRLLDHGFFRIGTEAYAQDHDTFGLATVRREHVSVSGDVVTFDYPAKGGQRRIQAVTDPAAVEVLRRLCRRRSDPPDLLVYRDGRQWRDVTARDVNDFLKAHVDPEATAKDFRTWNATVLAAVALAVSGQVAGSKTARKRAKSRAAAEVAHYLGNTPAVARASYIDPRVFDRYDSGWTIAGVIEALGARTDFGELSFQGEIEEAVIDLLEGDRHSPALERIA